ncbi:hypothetical protein KI809_11620 [Geobacter pelophilus]|uniref:Uncharacterized protein n=1 Tax=Geoanaerobacter pelophilus TaxID=60036 RepID=A0AAW4L250_9BACT|nr:hypothetical protein [Geoanaerobacter pelophilus]MBT0664948.1 hypothetical protein [Geoanaerobacter pelophilus]
MKKKLIVAATAGALTLAASQAFALENQFNGMYKLKYIVGNYETGGSAYLTPNKKSATAANYFEQRARIFYTAKATEGLALKTGFEIDSVFGDRAQNLASRGSGGALESDATNLETKWVYLDFAIPSTPVSVKAGIQPYKDAIKGTFLDGDIAGIYASGKFGAATTGIGYFRAYEGYSNGFVIAPRGTDNLDILAVDAAYALTKNINVGGAYYLYADYRTAAAKVINTLALTADAKVGPATISGFAAYQGGYSKGNTTGVSNRSVSAMAANVAAKMPVGPGTAKAAFLFTSGDKKTTDSVDRTWTSATTNIQGSNTGVVTSSSTAGVTVPNTTVQTPAATAANSYNESGMMLLNRNTAAGGTSTDQEIFYTTSGVGGRGVTLLTFGYDASITPKLFVNSNVGFGLNSASNGGNGNQFVGTEINTEVGYKLYDNLTSSVQAAYVFLGDFYKNSLGTGSDPVNPYTARVVLSYTF